MENGEQKIFVWCDFSHGMDDAILHGIMIASILQKELCLFHIVNPNRHERLDISEARLRSSVSKIADTLSAVRVRFFVTEQEVVKSLDDLAEHYECLVLVAHKGSANELLPVLQYAAFPFLFVSAQNNIDQIYKKIVVPVGYMKKSKDLALWASYLGRHYGSQIDLFESLEGWEEDQKSVKSNLFSIQRFYSKFKFPTLVIESHTPTWKLQKASLSHALTYKFAMLIVAASFKTTLIDTWLGLTEAKVILKSEDISVMCVNSRRDFYTFCN